MTSHASQTPGAHYIGRFAPSPSGPLHMGSLVCALASYLDARANSGQWLVRIEDIDPPREQPGATRQILHSLHCHGLQADAPPVLQSRRSEAYRSTLADLEQQQLVYRCNCNRKRLASLDGVYDGHCLRSPPPVDSPCALRLNIARAMHKTGISDRVQFTDALQGEVVEELARGGDFVLHRKDGLFAYQLAVVVDDIAQSISHIVRGCDLLDTTARQVFLTRLLGGTPAQYTHLPVLVGEDGRKLSKQNHAPAIDDSQPLSNLIAALRYLQMPPPDFARTDITALLSWAVEHWDCRQLANRRAIPA